MRGEPYLKITVRLTLACTRMFGLVRICYIHALAHILGNLELWLLLYLSDLIVFLNVDNAKLIMRVTHGTKFQS